MLVHHILYLFLNFNYHFQLSKSRVIADSITRFKNYHIMIFVKKKMKFGEKKGR